MGGVTPVQIMIVVAIVLLIFGPSRLPEIARSAGRGIRELKGSLGGPGPGPVDAAPRGGDAPAVEARATDRR